MEYSRPRKRRAPPSPSQGPQPYDRSRALPDAGRVICVFGPPGAGTSTVVRCLTEASMSPIAVIVPGFDDLEAQIRQALAQNGAGIAIVDGFPHCGQNERGEPAGPRAIQYLFDRRLVYAQAGAIVRVAVDPELLVFERRASGGGLRAWLDGLPALEAHIRMLSMPYYVVHNERGEEGLMQAVGDLARRASIAR